MKHTPITLSPSDARKIVSLLGHLQGHLESAIESSLVPGTGQPNPHCAMDVKNVAADRKTWRECEDMVIVSGCL